MEKPEWDISSKKGQRLMAEWLDLMLDEELEERFVAAQEEWWQPERVEWFQAWWQPVQRLLQKLRSGSATVEEQKRAASLLDPAPKKRGRKPRSKAERDLQLVMAAQDAKRIKALWKAHYSKSRSVAEKADEFAAWRSVRRSGGDGDLGSADVQDLRSKIAGTIRRPDNRNFSKY